MKDPTENRSTAGTPDVPGRRTKRPYRTPTLVEYGSVAKLTQTGGSTRSDSVTPGVMRRQCL